MRERFAQMLLERARDSDDIFLITADAGFDTLKEFRDTFPSRFLNIGIAEATMIGVSAGLSMGGWRAVAYTIAPFLAMRAFEQIRDDICYPNLPVLLAGVGGGLIYGTAGATHQALEDIALMSVLPNMTIYSPSDAAELQHALTLHFEAPTPAYFRLARSGSPRIHSQQVFYQRGQLIPMTPGTDLAILATGPIVEEAIIAANLLSQSGISAAVFSVPMLKPLDTDYISQQIFARYGAVYTLEEHQQTGGLGSIIARHAAVSETAVKVMAMGVPDTFIPVVGDRKYLLEYFDLSAAKIAGKIISDRNRLRA